MPSKHKPAKKSKTGPGTSYDPQFCQILIEHMSQGLSFEAFRGVIGRCKKTLYTWLEEQPDFAEAYEIGKGKSLLFWEKQGIQGLWGSKESSFNASVWIFNMKNRHQWRDKQPDEVDVIVNQNNYQSKSDEELEKRKAELLAKVGTK